MILIHFIHIHNGHGQFYYGWYKLTENNFHVSKQKIELILTFREVDHVTSERNPHIDGTDYYKKWLQKDKLARAIIVLSLSDDMLEHVREISSSKEMWDSILNVFQRHTLLNKLRARRGFYTVEMDSGEKMLSYINQVHHLGSTPKSMGVDIDDQEMAMAVLNGLQSKYENIITALDAVGNDSDCFSLDLVKSRLLQEEQRSKLQTHSTPDNAALLSSYRPPAANGHRNSFKCTHCGRAGHLEKRCYAK